SAKRKGSKKGDEAEEEFPRRHTFSYEVPDDPLAPAAAQKTYTSKFSFSSYRPPDFSDKPLEFGTAFEFFPAEPAKDFTEDSAQPDLIPKEYKSIFTFESAFPDSELSPASCFDDDSSTIDFDYVHHMPKSRDDECSHV
ncbi:unnamed protein product, partial [Dibothriocephalus latus]